MSNAIDAKRVINPEVEYSSIDGHSNEKRIVIPQIMNRNEIIHGRKFYSSQLAIDNYWYHADNLLVDKYRGSLVLTSNWQQKARVFDVQGGFKNYFSLKRFECRPVRTTVFNDVFYLYSPNSNKIKLFRSDKHLTDLVIKNMGVTDVFVESDFILVYSYYNGLFGYFSNGRESSLKKIHVPHISCVNMEKKSIYITDTDTLYVYTDDGEFQYSSILRQNPDVPTHYKHMCFKNNYIYVGDSYNGVVQILDKRKSKKNIVGEIKSEILIRCLREKNSMVVSSTGHLFVVDANTGVLHVFE
jgi:hypothetical protein